MLHSRRRRAVAGPRRGSALMLVLVMTFGLAAMAMSAIYLSSSTQILSRLHSREQDLRYAAEAGLAMGRSLLLNDAEALPDTGFRELTDDVGQLYGADGEPIEGMTLKLYAGPTGFERRQYGRFGSLIADASDGHGGRVVRRLEVAEESFAKFAYFSNRETNNSAAIYFAPSDALWGPVWSNDNINIYPNVYTAQKATFHGDVGTAQAITGKAYATFDKGYSEQQKPIKLPTNRSLSNLPGYALSGSLKFTAPTSGDAQSVRMRLEFVTVDLNEDSLPDPDEGFVRIYDAKDPKWLRGDDTTNNCGDWHVVRRKGNDDDDDDDDKRKGKGKAGKDALVFFPISVHREEWFKELFEDWKEDDDDKDKGGGNDKGFPEDVADDYTAVGAVDPNAILRATNARCFAGGDPHLTPALVNDYGDGGDSSTFFRGDPNAAVGAGEWRRWTGAVDPRVRQALKDSPNRSEGEADYLFPLSRLFNPGYRGVIDVTGTVAVSGRVRAQITLHSDATIVIIDDVRYATDPASGFCRDILGIIAERDVILADNNLLSPRNVGMPGPNPYRTLDDTKDAYIQSVIMATGTSFMVENYAGMPRYASDCEGALDGRGCLYLTGGLIQEARGPVGTTGGTGFLKRYSYDRCAIRIPPPYFPTTGRFTDNRHYEMDPVRFNVAAAFKSLAPKDEQ